MPSFLCEPNILKASSGTQRFQALPGLRPSSAHTHTHSGLNNISYAVTKHTKMATTSRSLYRTLCLRSFSTSTKPTHHNSHQQNHQYTEPNSFIGCWEAPKDPKEAEAKLAQLRRDYAKQVKEVRKEYIKKVELMRLDKLRKDEARKEALRLQNEERKRLKAEAAKVRAQQREVAEQEFLQTLLKERAEKLENWKMKEKLKEEMKKDEKELLRRKSSMWIDEQELEKKILEAIVDTTPL